jgi:signal-transduction protein with cAMP-binding, CBS, and nucleotidyltransferase domain
MGQRHEEEQMPTRLRDVMTADPSAVAEAATIQDAARIMRDHDIGDVIVTSNGSIVGIVTDRDIVVRAIADGRGGTTTVGSICSDEVQTLEADDPVALAAALMRERHIRRIPIVEGGQLVGVVSLGDLAEEKDPESVLGEISGAPPNR